MSILAEDSAVVAKIKELCETITQDEEFIALQSKVEKFLSDDVAKLQYQNVHELGESLHQKQHAGEELSESEIKSFEDARDELMENVVAREFMEAQQALQTLQKTVGKYVGMTLELGRVPEPEDMEHAGGGGCCGGGGGGGCGCH